MRKMVYGVITLVIALSSCKRVDDCALPQGKKFTTSIGFSGINISDSEMQGGGLKVQVPKDFEDDDLIGIQVYKKDGVSQVVASGVFTGDQIRKSNEELTKKNNDEAFNEVDIFQVTLEHGFDYVLESTMIKGGNAVDLSSNYGVPFDNQEKIDVADWTNSPHKFDFTQRELNKNNITEHDRWYYKNEFKADYSEPVIDFKLRRLSFKVNLVVYNVKANTEVIGFIKTGNPGPAMFINFPSDNATSGITSDMCNTQVILNAGKSNEKTVIAHKISDRIFTMPDITNAFACVKTVDGDGNDVEAKELAQEVELTFGVLTKGANLETTPPLRVINASFKPKPNYQYQIVVDAETEKVNVVGISANEPWNTDIITIEAEEIVVHNPDIS